jgi:hypothetical protein
MEEKINEIENAYHNSNLVYESLLSHFMSMKIPFLTVPMKKGSIITRARYTKGNNSFTKLREVSYPKSSIVTQFSRLNRPLQSLFYGSENTDACLSEMMPFWFNEIEVDDIITITIGSWLLDSDLCVFIIPDVENLNQLNQKIIRSLNVDELKFWNYTSKKFKISTKDEGSIYEFTAALGNALLLISSSNNLNVDGFLYSSVQSPKNLNVALKTKIADSQILVPKQFQELQVKKIGYDKNRLPLYMEIGERKKGKPDSNNENIIWL